MQKITVGLFNDSFPPMVDGVGMVVDNYARRLSKKCNVIVFVPRYKGSFDDSRLPYKVVRCRSISLPFIDYSLPLPFLDWKFLKEVKKYSFDIIHIHSPFSLGKLGIRTAKRLSIPVLGTMHSQFKQDFLRAVKIPIFSDLLTKRIVRVFNKCSRCYAVNGGMAKLYYEDYGVKVLPLVLGNATEMEYLQDRKEACSLVNSFYHLSSKDKVFLFVGRMNKLKNIFFIVDGLSLLSKKSLNYSYKMLFVGDGQDFLELKSYIQKMNMEEEIILCGKISNRGMLTKLYARSDLFLFPSLYDASSIVQIEAASQKVPTVFLEGAKTSSDITNRQNGFVVKDVYEFAEVIDEVMNNRSLYKSVSEGAYRDVYKRWDDVVEEVYQIYLSFIGEG